MSELTKMRVNLDRIKADVETLASIGRCDEDQGLYRMAFTDADIEARKWLLDRIDNAGLISRSDGAANIFGVLASDHDSPSLVVGSHLDTVPCAGSLDGSLGVVVGLECLRVINQADYLPDRDVELVAFSDEEGRFGGMLGSEAFIGNINPLSVQHASDASGFTLSEAMLSQGLDPSKVMEARRNPSTIDRYLELHIEQGPVLDHKGLNVGVVDEITGLFRWNLKLIGESNHAGTTPMEMRRDAFMGLADFAHEIPRILDEIGSESARATVGQAEIQPGAPNTVPGMVAFTLDVRDTNQELLEALKDAFHRALVVICRRRQLKFDMNEVSSIDPVRCDSEIIKILEEGVTELGLKALRMPSGAAHDAQIMGRLYPVGMIFVPSRGGKSHSPDEWTSWTDIEAGANLLLHAILKLTAQKQSLK